MLLEVVEGLMLTGSSRVFFLFRSQATVVVVKVKGLTPNPKP